MYSLEQKFRIIETADKIREMYNLLGLNYFSSNFWKLVRKDLTGSTINQGIAEFW